MEPACVAVFRDEMVNLFPGDEVAKRLNRQTYFFSEFLVKKAPHFSYPQLAGRLCSMAIAIRKPSSEWTTKKLF